MQKQFTIALTGHASTRAVFLFKGQIILQTMKKDCGCTSCKEQEEKIVNKLTTAKETFFYENISGTPFVRIYKKDITNKIELNRFLQQELGLGVSSIKVENAEWSIKEKVSFYGDICGDAVTYQFGTDLLYAIMGDRKSNSLTTSYKKALKGKVFSPKKLDDFLKRARVIRRKYLKNNDDEKSQQQFIQLRDQIFGRAA